MRWGKMKLQRRYIKIYGTHISSWKIQRVIEDNNLYFDHVVQQKRERKETSSKEP